MCGSQRDMDVEDIVAADVLAHLANGLQERQRFDIADRAADLDDDDIGAGGLRDQRRCGALISLVMCGMTWIVPPR